MAVLSLSRQEHVDLSRRLELRMCNDRSAPATVVGTEGCHQEAWVDGFLLRDAIVRAQAAGKQPRRDQPKADRAALIELTGFLAVISAVCDPPLGR